MLPFNPVVFIQEHMTNSPLRDQTASVQLLFLKFWHIVLKFLVVIRLVVVQDSIVIKTVNENDLRENVPKELIRTTATVN